MQEAVLDLGVEQVLSPALTRGEQHVRADDARARHPDRGDRHRARAVGRGRAHHTGCVREVGYAVQSEFHSPTSQYGQLTRRGRYDHLDFATTMRRLADDIESGRFADEWDAERDAGYPNLVRCASSSPGRPSASSRSSSATELGRRQRLVKRQSLLISSPCHEDGRRAHQHRSGTRACGSRRSARRSSACSTATTRTRRSSRSTTRPGPRCRRSR